LRTDTLENAQKRIKSGKYLTSKWQPPVSDTENFNFAAKTGTFALVPRRITAAARHFPAFARRRSIREMMSL
jgi:hypothetical protein